MRSIQAVLSIILVTALAGCGSTTATPDILSGVVTIAAMLAESAPPAKPPEVYAQDGLHQWEGDPNYYSTGYHFTLYLKNGFANSLEFKEDGKVIPYFDGNDPQNGAHTVYYSSVISSSDTGHWTQTSITIIPPQGGQPNGTTHT